MFVILSFHEKKQKIEHDSPETRMDNDKSFTPSNARAEGKLTLTTRFKCIIPKLTCTQLTGPPWSGAGAGVGMVRGALDSLT